MNTRVVVAGMAAWVLVAAGYETTNAGSRVDVSARSPGVAVSVSYFHDELAAYGTWVDYGPHGSCWVPADVSEDWRPYDDGYWVNTDYGWSWVSYEPWGWATCHYGRWDYDSYYGWVWVPGTVWAPAWVAWHCSDDWVGWAPLPPSARWNVSVGLRFGDVDRIPARRWCFVERRHFSDHKLRSRICSPARNEWLIQRTRDVTRFEVRNGRPMNHGVDVSFVEKGTRHKMQKLRIVDADSPKLARGHAGRDEVSFYRPKVREEGLRSGPPPSKRGRELAVAKPTLQKQHQRQRRNFDQAISRDRSRPEREQSQAVRGTRRPSGAAKIRGPQVQETRRPNGAAKIRGQQVQERQSSDRQAAGQRQRVEERHQKRVGSAERSRGSSRSESSSKAKRSDSGERRQKGRR